MISVQDVLVANSGLHNNTIKTQYVRLMKLCVWKLREGPPIQQPTTGPPIFFHCTIVLGTKSAVCMCVCGLTYHPPDLNWINVCDIELGAT